MRNLFKFLILGFVVMSFTAQAQEKNLREEAKERVFPAKPDKGKYDKGKYQDSEQTLKETKKGKKVPQVGEEAPVRLLTATPKELSVEISVSRGVSHMILQLLGVSLLSRDDNLETFYAENHVLLEGDAAYATVQLGGSSNTPSETFYLVFTYEGGVRGFDNGMVHTYLGDREMSSASCSSGVRTITTMPFTLYYDYGDEFVSSNDIYNYGTGGDAPIKLTMDDNCWIYFKSVSVYTKVPLLL